MFFEDHRVVEDRVVVPAKAGTQDFLKRMGPRQKHSGATSGFSQ